MSLGVSDPSGTHGISGVLSGLRQIEIRTGAALVLLLAAMADADCTEAMHLTR